MSVHVMSWVLKSSPERLGRRLVLLVLADHAKDDGTSAWPSVATISEQARLSERQARTCLRELESSGAITATGKSRNGTVVYTVLMRGADTAPPATAGAEESDRRGGEIVQVAVSETAPDPPVVQPPVRQPPKTALGKVDRLPVKAQHEQLARSVLALWNEITDQSNYSHDWLRMVVMRIREHPDFTLSEHEHVIQASLADPWWTGHPALNMIYGNGAQFERCITRAEKGPATQKRRYGLGMTTEEILRSTRE